MDRVFQEKTCESCGTIYTPTCSRQKYCSENCRRRNRKNYYSSEYHKQYREERKEYLVEYKKKYREEHKEEISENRKISSNKTKVEKKCIICGSIFFTNTKRKTTCSLECSKKRKDIYFENWSSTDIAIESMRKAANRRRSRLNSVMTEYIDFGFVWERDDGTCQICMNKIDKNLSYKDRYSLQYDHIVPISKGGNDVTSNIQLSHRTCNASKHDKENFIWVQKDTGNCWDKSIEDGA